MNIRLWLIALLVVLLPRPDAAVAQSSAGTEPGFEYRPFDQEQLEEFRQDEDFVYQKTKHSRFPLWEAFLQTIGKILEKLFGVAPSYRTVEIIIYILSGLILLWAIIRLVGMDKNISLKRKPPGQEMAYEIKEEDIHEIDFGKEVEQARQAQRWRLLIRLQYLWALKLLSDAGLLQVKAGKTNHDYLYEIGEPGLKEVFGKLSYIFEYTWYGHFEADEPVRKAADEHSLRLKNLLGGR